MAIDEPTRTLARLSALSVICIAAACQSTAVSDGLPDGYQDGRTYEQPSQDRSVEAHLTQVIRTSQIIDSFRVVELELCNQAPEAISFAYSVEWLDRAGKTIIDQGASWTPIVLGAGETIPVEFRAPSPRADSWRLMAAALPK